MSDPARYRFGPLERRGVVAGLTPGQVMAIGTGLAAAVAMLRLVPGYPGAVAAAVAVFAGAGVAFAGVGGRRVEEWLPVVARWALSGVGGARRWRSPAPLSGRPPAGRPTRGRPAAGRPSDRASVLGPPPALAGCRVLPPLGGGGLSVIDDPARGTVTAVLGLHGGGFTLLDRADQERRVAAWAAVLAGLARQGCAVHRVQWVERARPVCAGAPQPPPAAAAPEGAAASYAQLVRDAGRAERSHEVLLAVSVRHRRGRRGAPRDGGSTGALPALEREVAALDAALRSAEVDVEGLLGAAALRHVLATGFDPAAPGGRDPWPLAAEAAWSAWRCDGWWHATYWIAEWPRADVGPDFLASLLLLGPEVRSVSVVMEPVPPSRAIRQVEVARTSGAADDELRRRSGFLATARRRRQRDGTAQREAELADGHADYRFSGYLTVSAPAAGDLESACAEVEQGAAQSSLQLRRLYGEQDTAFAYTLPMGRGLS